jgi:UPF0176 protein
MANDDDHGGECSSMDSTGDTCRYQILALYKFVTPKFAQEQLKPLQQELETKCRHARVRGCIVVAPEGVNGTICYPNDDHGGLLLLDFLRDKFPGLRCRLSSDSRSSFARLKIKIKHEIVTLLSSSCDDDEDDDGGACCDPTERVGTYVPPGPEWNQLLQDPDCMVIDARNEYEVRLGTFRNAMNPRTQNFKQFPEWLSRQVETANPKSVAMFCTGGIRCEKATSLALASKVFPDDTPIYHLEGGILGYLDQVPEEESLFEGECYVFDKRVAVTHGLRPSKRYTQCHACRNPLTWEEKEREDYEEGLQCRYCATKITDKQRERFRDRQKQCELASKLGTPHMHDPKECYNL